MTSLVTGGGGFVGRHVVEALAARGEPVRVLDLDPPADLPAGVEAVRGSVTDAGTVRTALAGVDTVYHLAANPHLWARDPAVFDRVNHGGTRTVLAEAERAGVAKLVHTSSLTTLIGRRTLAVEVPLDESVTVSPDDLLGPYPRSKALAERAVLDAARRGLPAVVVLPTMPVGPGDRSLTPPTRMILDFVNGAAPAYLECTLNLIDVRHLAAAHLAAAERGRPGERYLLGNANLWMSAFLALLGEVSGVPMPRRRVPYRVALAAAGTEEWAATHLTGKPPQAPATGVRLAGRPAFFDSSKAVRELGLRQAPLHRTLHDQLLWLRDRGLVKRALPGLG
jgi:dihydroflavonol-4-reductase